MDIQISNPTAPLGRPPFTAKIDLQMGVGRFLIKTLSTADELRQAFLLRYQVFQLEMIGQVPALHEDGHQSTPLDTDEFDFLSDHLAIFDIKTNQMIATCRLNCSLFSQRFYSEQEFHCQNLLALPATKVELGRVCVHRDFRRGIVIMLLWRAVAEYMAKTEAQFLFGCGSVATLDPLESVILYRALEEEGHAHAAFDISPTEKYRSREFENLLEAYQRPLTSEEREQAQKLLPPLCRSYFDMGCFSPGAPAFDREFKCIDFLTILDMNKLDPRIRKKIIGD